jgi:hypothetical protein
MIEFTERVVGGDYIVCKTTNPLLRTVEVVLDSNQSNVLIIGFL